MNLNQFTIKAQESVQNAFQIAQQNGNQAVETGHLIKSLFDESEDVIGFLLKKINVNVSRVQDVINSIVTSYPKVSGGEPYLSKDAAKALQKAISLSKDAGDQFVSIEYILAGLLDVGDQVTQVLKDNGVSQKELKKAIEELRKGEKVTSQTAEQTFDSLNRYAINLNDRARNGKLDPVIGRDEEIRRVLQILSRRTKNNPILVGEPGVGKTAIAEGLAHRIVNGDVPENLKSKQVYSLDMGALVAGAKYKGEFEERLKAVVKEVIASEGDVVLFIDEIHTLVGAGRGDGAMDAANILKPALARGELRAVGATTLDEYQKYFEKDKALERRFQIVMIDEPDTLSAISILRGIKDRYETHHQVRIRDEAIISSVELSQRYISDRFLPDKAIDLMDEAASKLRLEMNSVPEEIDLLDRRIQQLEIEREAIKREGNEPKIKQLSEEIANLSEERNELRAKWQSERKIIEKIQTLKNEIENYKVEAQQAERSGDYGKVAEIRYGKIKDAEAEMEKMNQELQDQQADSALIKEEVTSDDIAEVVARWTGIPVSRMLQSEREKLLTLEDELHHRVVGQDEAIAVISDAVRRNRAGLSDPKRPIGSFIFLGTTGVGKTELARALAEFLFNDENMMTRIDMSEYQERHSVSRLVGAPPGYVGYDEGGQLTEAVRHKPYSVVLLDEIEKAHPDVFNILLQVLDDGRLTDNKGRTVNFKNTIIIMTSNIGSHLIMEKMDGLNDKNREKVLEQTRIEVMDLLKQTIRPEFINRVDEIVVFKPLHQDEIKQVVMLQVENLKKMVKLQGIELKVTESAIEWLSAAGYDPQFGARPVKRVIQKNILNELSKRILSGSVMVDKPIIVDVEKGDLIFEN
ncbi:MAG: ATP-dependent chaperone ClpB [Bacteroidales bacterium]|jgi:ATP-dependent Clp protease ATP-binding subunit ClpB|nr:ATP-dependent chaperone ClpB [Bacteroidales bacterium]